MTSSPRCDTNVKRSLPKTRDHTPWPRRVFNHSTHDEAHNRADNAQAITREWRAKRNIASWIVLRPHHLLRRRPAFGAAPRAGPEVVAARGTEAGLPPGAS